MNVDEKFLSVLGAIQSSLESVQSDLTDLKQGQAKLEDTVGQMNDRLVKVESGQARLEDTVGQMNDRLMNVEDAVGRIEVEQVAMKEDIQFVRNTTTRIEQDHGRKLTALHDGYQQVYDKVTRLEDQVDTYENQPHLHLLPPKDKK